MGMDLRNFRSRCPRSRLPGLDRRNDAVREGAKAIESRRFRMMRSNGTFYRQIRRIQTRVGNTDEALWAIRQLLDLSAGLMMSLALLS
jgi:hypothetical protein